MKYTKWIALLLALSLLLCGCGSSVIIEGVQETEETEPEATVSDNPFWVEPETEPVGEVSAVEFPYDYTLLSFFEMNDFWEYAPVAVCKGVLDNGEPFLLQAQDGYAVSQGACSDGTYGYFYIAKPSQIIDGVSQDIQYIYKVDLATWEIVKRSESLQVQHANGACYNPNTNMLVSANMTPDGKTLSLVDAETLELVGTAEVYTDISAIAYCAERDQYVVRLTGTQAFDFAILDSDFQLVAEYDGVNALIGIQNIFCDENYIYRLDSGCVKRPGTEGIIVYDWEGNYQGVYRIGIDVNGTTLMEVGETESLFMYDGKFYLSILTGAGGEFYELEMDVDELYW